MPTPDEERAHPRRWPVVIGLVTAVALTGVVATGVVLGNRVSDRAQPAPAASTTTSAVPAPPPGPASVDPTPAGQPSDASTDASPGASTGASTGPSPGIPAPGAPTAAPREPLPTSSDLPTTAPGPDRTLRTNSLYSLDLGSVSATCDVKVRRPKPPLPDKKLEGYLTSVVGCLTDAFTPALAREGFTLARPKVVTYHKRVETPCGTFGQDGSPAYYCSSTRTVYWPDTVDDGREAYTFARLGYVGLLAHEFGHHLQATTGLLTGYAEQYQKASTKERYALSRRLELQAQCFEGVFLHVAGKDLDVSSEDRAELRTWHSYTGDEDPPKDRKPDHGTSRAQFRWLERGLDSGDLGDCNTWSASGKSVT